MYWYEENLDACPGTSVREGVAPRGYTVLTMTVMLEWFVIYLTTSLKEYNLIS